jgi:hypothetical protein
MKKQTVENKPLTAEVAVRMLEAAGYKNTSGYEQGFDSLVFQGKTNRTIEFFVYPRHTRRIDQGYGVITKLRTVKELEVALSIPKTKELEAALALLNQPVEVVKPLTYDALTASGKYVPPAAITAKVGDRIRLFPITDGPEDDTPEEFGTVVAVDEDGATLLAEADEAYRAEGSLSYEWLRTADSTQFEVVKAVR